MRSKQIGFSLGAADLLSPSSVVGEAPWTARSLLPLSCFGSLLPGGDLRLARRLLSPYGGLAAGCID